MSTAVAAMLLATSCQNEEIINQQESNLFRLEVQKGGSSRTAIASNGSVTWSKGDKLFVYGENGTYGILTLDDADAGSESGTFTGFVKGNINDLKYVAYGDGVKKVGDDVKVTLGDITLPNSNAPMFATLNPSNLNSVTLQHVCGVVRMNIVGLKENDIVSVVGKAIAGSATFNEVNATLVADNTTTEQTIKVTGAKDSYHIDVPALAGGTIEKILVNSVECDIKDVKVVAKTLDASSIPTLNMKNGTPEETDEAVKSIDDLKEAVETAGAVVTVAAGKYGALNMSFAEGVTIVCEEGTIFEGWSKGNINGATIIGATFSNPTSTVMDQRINGNFKKCTFVGKNGLKSCNVNGEIVFEDCKFKGEDYNFHFDNGYGKNDKITCINCEFTGFRIINVGAGVEQLIMRGCVFNKTYTNSYCNTWGNALFENCVFNNRDIQPLGGYNQYINCKQYDNPLTIENLTLYKNYDCNIKVDNKEYNWSKGVLTEID